MSANPNRTRFMDRDGIPSFTDAAVYQDPRQFAGGQLAYVTETVRYAITGAGGVGATTPVCPLDPAEIDILMPDGTTPIFRKVLVAPDGTKSSINSITGAAGATTDVVLNADGSLTVPTAIAPNTRAGWIVVKGYRKNASNQD